MLRMYSTLGTLPILGTLEAGSQMEGGQQCRNPLGTYSLTVTSVLHDI